MAKRETVMSNYERLLAAINEHVEAEVRAGRIVDANLAAISLSSQFPQSGIAVGDIVQLIENETVMASGVLYNGSRANLVTE